MAARILLAAFCIVLPITAQLYKPKTQIQKEWALGAGAMVAQIDGDRLNLLAGSEITPQVAVARRQNLRNSWEIRSRQDLLGEVQTLLKEDWDNSRIGWNYPRVINLARWGFAAGYLDEDEAWGFIIPAAERLQKTFSSWQELGQSYLDGRARWYSRQIGSRRQAEYAYRVLLADQGSPWRRYPWNLDLWRRAKAYAAPPSVDKTAWLELAAHPEGLMCVRITVPDHRDEVEYESAIETAVGCHPRITGQRRDGTDWILDTECFQPSTLHGAQIVAQFSPEAIAEQLRREGITQLFTYFEHVPHGSGSELVPPVLDDWFSERGWQWYVGCMRSTAANPIRIRRSPTECRPARVQIFLIQEQLLFCGCTEPRSCYLGARQFSVDLALPAVFLGILVGTFRELLRSGDRRLLVGRGRPGRGCARAGLVWLISSVASVGNGDCNGLLGAMWRAIIPDLRLSRILFMSFSRVMAEVPVATVLVLLCDPQRPLNLATVIALLGLGAAIAFTAL